MKYLKWIVLVLAAWLPGICHAAADLALSGANTIVNTGVYNNVTVTAAGCRLYNVTILGTLTVSESVELRSCIMDYQVTFGVDNDNVLTAWCCTFAQSEATIEAAGEGGFVTDSLDPASNSTNKFSTDCRLGGYNQPLNPACWKCGRSDKP